MTEDLKPKSLDDTSVAEYLSKHPDFFVNHSHLLVDLVIPHQSGAAVSLVERQVDVMRETNKELRIRLNKLLDVARENDIHFENTKALVVALMDTLAGHNDIAQILAIFDDKLQKYLAADTYSLIIFDNKFDLDHDKLKLETLANAKSHISNILDEDKSQCGIFSTEERDFLFAKNAQLVASAAVIPLHYKQLNGLLVIGSFNQDHFHNGMGTIFLDYLSDIISRVCFAHLFMQESNKLAM